ncbi:MAG: NAD(P)H-binding protein [Planctomycetes bacterium]|nr:NAD(P)H-binding protein [Planctomycetota bacterium]
MTSPQTHVVTGAFGYTGKYIAQRLLDAGHAVRTLTNSPQRTNPFGSRVAVHPYNFDDPPKLVAALEGADVLYNTYWVRFTHKLFKQADAVDNTLTLFEAAKQAGVKRIVHVSITNPSDDSPLEYFSGKARLERALIESGLSYAILRPAVLFGHEDILINNIAWMLRKLPIFGVFGNGRYRLQPMYVEDFADLAVHQAAQSPNVIIDAIGPETFTFRELVKTIAQAIGVRRLIVPVPPALGFALGWLLGRIKGDVIITRQEIRGLMDDLLYVDSPPAGSTKLSAWARQHADDLGKHYANELARRIDRRAAYEQL